jgi:hypothetical protein
LFQVVKQRTTLAAGLTVPLHIRGGRRIELAVEVCMHAQ